MSKTIDKRLYNYPAGPYCGVLVPEEVMRKIAKYNLNYASGIRKILNEYKDELYVSNWTSATKWSGNKIVARVTVTYTEESATEEKLDQRISLFSEALAALPAYVPEVFLVNSRDEATRIAEEKLAERLKMRK